MDAQNAIFELAEHVAADVPVIFRDGNGKRPGRPYITLKVTPAARLPVHLGAVDDSGGQQVSAHREAGVELQYFGDDAFQALDEISLRLGFPSIVDFANGLDLAVFDVGDVQDIPVPRDKARFEPRAVLDLRVRYTGTQIDTVGTLEGVEIGGSLSGGITEVPAIEIPAAAP
ncbi:phage neck terminator protein [Bordetella petrii]|uniref:Secreted protein n=1 Tax=Bordetella petrii (strain ATCC BAA-461 / DSM 12804 / CCUG 43448 / CIP 107267 / Se-1111R) TaxID=340100 RepID=A9I920_BORPD|nr:hypothetical protein [Bordetella petrii]CAP41318.1 putative secreted protein [Bordetella petrii]